MLNELKIIREWIKIHDHFGVPVSFSQVLDILGRYKESHRAYHTSRHIADCLREFDSLYGRGTKADDALAIKLALIFHDVIYDVSSKTNEEDSAAYARVYMSVKDFPAMIREEVSRLIILTKKHRTVLAEDSNGEKMIDVDMSVLAWPWEKYEVYAKGIWHEYSSVADQTAYREGRAAFLSSIHPEHVFCTPEMTTRANHSNVAWNIAKEIDALGRGSIFR